MLEEPSRCHKTAAARGGCFRGYHPLPCTVWFGALTLQQTPNTPPKQNPKTKKTSQIDYQSNLQRSQRTSTGQMTKTTKTEDNGAQC